MRITFEVGDDGAVQSSQRAATPHEGGAPGAEPDDSGHTPVSNSGAEADGTAGESEQPPSTGDGVQAVTVSESRDTPTGDVEDLAGYRRPGAAAAAALAVHTDEGLRDIGEASFGPAPESVFSPDDRVQVTNTSVYAWRVHCSLRITARDGSQWIGTGWFCGPHTLVTAGHCVFIKNSGVPGRDGWVRSITVIPGRNGTNEPYGSAVSSTFRSVTGWTNDANHEFDYGAILLSTNLGDRTGWLGFGNYSDATLRSSVANITGYPGDKPAGTQWFHARQVTAVGPRKVFYDVDTAGGQSGSAVYRLVNGARFAVAIHAYGGATSNSGTRINADVFNNLVAWKA